LWRLAGATVFSTRRLTRGYNTEAMNIDEMRKIQRAEPFRPYTIHVADGRAIRVEHPEFVALGPAGRTAVAFTPDGSFEIIDLRLVTTLQVVDGQN